MKFKFCGNLDCPDWLLLEITNLSKLSAVKVKLLSSHCVKCILDNEQIDRSKVQQHSAQVELEENKSIVAGLRFILIEAAKHDTVSMRLGEELQQLGLPKEHSEQIIKCYDENLAKLSKVLLAAIPRNSKPSSSPIKWTVKRATDNSIANATTRIALSDADTVPIEPLVTLEMKYDSAGSVTSTQFNVCLTYFDFLCLKDEMGRLLGRMSALKGLQ